MFGADSSVGPGDCRLDVAEDGVDPLEGRVLGSGTA